jgi:hypothetical protein
MVERLNRSLGVGKSVQIIVHEAVDGKRFDTADQCAEYEVGILDQLLTSLNPDLIREALKRRGFSIRNDRSRLDEIAARAGAERADA